MLCSQMPSRASNCRQAAGWNCSQRVAAAPLHRHSSSGCRRFKALAPSAALLKETQVVPVTQKGELSEFPAQPGVYAVYNKDGDLQYIGLSRKVNLSVSAHMQQLPDDVAAIKFDLVSDASREGLTDAWKAWVQEAMEDTGKIPPGNAPGETKWQSRAVRAKSEIMLTAGKAINVPIETLIDQVVKGNRVVAFIKGTRTQPQCGFSFKVLQILNDNRAEYEVVNVLDEFHNPGLRDAIKQYSQWPTIPQLYIDGEFVGGADIVEQMQGNGELPVLLKKDK
eukprot:jgi/Chrzof1/9506/Cz04g05200.t1